MFQYKKYLVKKDDHFDEANYPMLQNVLEFIRDHISKLPDDFKNEIIFAFVKNNSLQPEWAVANPALAGLLALKSQPFESLRELFDSCSGNELFQRELETYIRKMLI